MSIASDAHRARQVRFGLTTALPRAGHVAADFARSVESAGFDVLTFADHLAPLVAPFTGAMAAAMATERLHVGTLVLNNDFRHPIDVARDSGSIATLSGGRFELGLGAGHMKSEYDAAGIPFDTGSVRVTRLVESTQIVRALLDGDAVDVDGDHYRVHCQPGSVVAQPLSPVPLLIGGNGTRVLQLAGRVADIVGLAGITHNHDATSVRLTHFDTAGVQDRISVVRNAAGDRFDSIELNALIQAVVVTDDPAAAAQQTAGEFGNVTAAQLLESPFVLFGTHEQMAQTLADRQRDLGVSYWTVFDELPGRASAMDDLAQVIALMR